MTDIELERRLGAYYRAEVGENETAPLSLRRDVVAIPRSARSAHRLGRGRGVTLFAAAALLLVAGAAAAGSGLLRLPSVVPPEPVPSLAVITTPSPVPSKASSAVPPEPGMFVYQDDLVVPAPGMAVRWGRLWIANVDGTGAHELVPDLGGDQRVPSWSSDGTRLVFSRAPASVDELGAATEKDLTRLYLTDATGSEPQLVDTGCVAPCRGDSDAAFSRDGKRLVFVRTVMVPPASTKPIPNTGGKVASDRPASVIGTIDLSTGRVTELASTTMVDCQLLPGQRAPGVVNCGFANHNPRWSPDGTQIVFSQDVPYDENGPRINGETAPNWPPSSIFVVDADGRNVHRVSQCCSYADWSPDGARIVFESGPRPVPVPRANPDGGYTLDIPNRDIYTSRPDGTDLRRLTTGRISSAPSWTADGRIWFERWITATPEQPYQLWIMDADGGNATQFSVSPLLGYDWPYGRPPQP